MAFYQIFLANFKLFYRNRNAFFWTVGMPSIIYVAVSILPLDRLAGNMDVDYSTFLLPGILALSIMQGGIYGLTYRIVDFKARGVLKRFTVTPVTRLQFVAGTVGALLSLMVIQALILTVIGVALFEVPVSLHPLHILLSIVFILLGGALFLLMGLFVATYADTYETAAPITSAIGLPLTFLSNIFYPLSVLPSTVQKVAEALPMAYFATGLRNSMLSAGSLQGIYIDLSVLIAWIIVLSILVAWRFRLEN